jgi:hypothetical protein
MLHSLICFSTSGQTAACTSLYLSRNSGLSFTICATLRPVTFCRKVGDMGGVLPGCTVGLDHILLGVGFAEGVLAYP